MYQIKANVLSGGRFFRFIGIERERIAFIKDSSEKNIETIDLSDKYIYPGFIDAHTHLLWYGLNLIRCNLSGVKSEEEIYLRIEKYARENLNSEYIIAEGFDETKFKKNKFPSKAMLDAMNLKKPVIVRRVCGHIAVLNEEAVRLLKNQLNGNFDNRSGIAREGIVLSLNTVLKPAKADMQRALSEAQNMFFSLGITSIGDMATYDSFDIYDSRNLKLDVFFYYPAMLAENLQGWKDRKNVKLKGLKLFTDGSIGGRTAALTIPYKNTKEKGEIVLKRTDFRKAFATAEKNSYQLAVHAIGDEAIEYSLKNLVGRKNDRIEHFELAAREQIDRVRKQSLMLSMQPNFIGNWAMKGQMYEERLDKKYYEFNNVVSEIYEKSIPLGFGSDCMPPSPVYGIESLAKAQFENQRMKPSISLKCYTEGSAEIMNEGKNFGKLEKGYFADMTVFDSPIEKIPAKNPRIVMTFKRGKKVFTKE
ncbi:MAG: amidohydrolase [bacterium]